MASWYRHSPASGPCTSIMSCHPRAPRTQPPQPRPGVARRPCPPPATARARRTGGTPPRATRAAR
eukprot:4635286-Prymnesium_polylepis.1